MKPKPINKQRWIYYDEYIAEIVNADFDGGERIQLKVLHLLNSTYRTKDQIIDINKDTIRSFDYLPNQNQPFDVS